MLTVEQAPAVVVTPGIDRMSGAVYAQILAMIVDGQFALNARLPSEWELCERFRTSRPVVREALARLRADRIVVSRKGSGSYVVKRPDQAILRFTPAGSIADIERCFRFRMEVESAAAAMAAEMREADDLAAIRGAYDALARGRLGVEEDIRFHQVVAEATHNQYYIATQASLRADLLRGMTVMRNLSLLRPPARLKLVQDEHCAVMLAIEEGDPDKARAAMRAHIDAARKRMFEGEEQVN
jgi:DNA-binding FadR family transcriptional regulator